MPGSVTICPNCRNPIPGTGVCACVAPGGAKALPPIYVSLRDFGRLERLARVGPDDCDEAVARFLAAELDRAIICYDAELPDDVVTMRSRVRFRTEPNGEAESRVLVYPEDYDPSGAALSILSPLGVALLGLREGSAMSYDTLHGGPRQVIVEEVAWRPDRVQPALAAPADRPDRG